MSNEIGYGRHDLNKNKIKPGPYVSKKVPAFNTLVYSIS